MKFEYLSSIAGLSLSLLFSSCNNEIKQEKPVNFIVIYLDDMGYGDLTRTGALGYNTPNIDRMASQGIFFSRYYSPQAVCTASRAGLLTGCYPNRIGLSGALGPASPVGIAEEEVTIAEMLKQEGYATAIFGKWHLGVNEKFLPVRHGFDEFFGIPYSNDMWPFHPAGPQHYPDLPLFENETIVNPAVSPNDQKQFTTWFTERTTEFIRKNSDRPFFVYLAHPMPHVPLFVSEKFRGKSEQGLFGDVMMELDWSVGQILKVLEETKLAENTLVILTSDNGPWINYGNNAGNTGGLREGKGTTYEGGHRVPCLMMWKGVTAPGTVNNNLVAGMDILPTLAEIAGAQIPVHPIDGVSILPYIKGKMTDPLRESFWYFYRENNLEAVQDGYWKLVFPHPGRTYTGNEPGRDGQPGKVTENFQHEAGLFDLRRDPGEDYNLIEYYPAIVKQLEEVATEARKELGDNLTGNKGMNRRLPGRITED